MNEKQKLFAQYYIANNFNSTQAALSAGYSKKTAYSQGQRLSKHVEVKKYIKQRIRDILSETESLTLKWVNRVTEIAFSEPRAILNKDGDVVGYINSDQLKALDLLAKYLSLYADLDIHVSTNNKHETTTKEERRERILKLTKKLS